MAKRYQCTFLRENFVNQNSCPMKFQELNAKILAENGETEDVKIGSMKLFRRTLYDENFPRYNVDSSKKQKRFVEM